MKKIIVTSGGFDPIHSGHVKLMNSAKAYGDYLIVGVNSDSWLGRKKGRAFMPFNERAAVVANLKAVDEVMSFNDADGSACDLLEKVKQLYPDYYVTFANGGDRTSVNIPEMKVLGVDFIFGVGGEDKANSSSWILEEWKSPKTIRSWGWYRVLDDHSGYKVKELVIEPGKKLSMQRHHYRSEHWHVLSGECCVNTEWHGSTSKIPMMPHSSYEIGVGIWHQGENNSDKNCHILEVQYGSQCIEEDIDRKPQ
jgi:cytidyltransferase-like protein